MTHYYQHRTRKFREIFKDAGEFFTEYTNYGLGGFLNDETVTTLYKLLWARRANDAIWSTDEDQFKAKLFSIIFEFGGVFEKKLEIVNRIQRMTDEELERGTVQVFNNAQNPSTTPLTQEFEQLKKINAQTAQIVKRSKLDYLMMQTAAMKNDFIEVFLKRFDKLFNPFPAEDALLYTIEGGDEDECY